jgi:hypothetical protein
METNKYMVIINDWPIKGTRKLKIFESFAQAYSEASSFLEIHNDFDNQIFITKKCNKYTLIINNYPTYGDRKITTYPNYQISKEKADNFLDEHIDMENELLIINGEVVYICQYDKYTSCFSLCGTN